MMHAPQVKSRMMGGGREVRNGRPHGPSRKKLLACAADKSHECHRYGKPRERTFMTTFCIDGQNNITAFASTEQIEGSKGETFSNEQELAALAEKWPAARLVEIWNSLPGVQLLQRFTSRKAALIRIGVLARRRRGSCESE